VAGNDRKGTVRSTKGLRERLLKKDNRTYEQVRRNNGAYGDDGMKLEQLPEYFESHEEDHIRFLPLIQYAVSLS